MNTITTVGIDLAQSTFSLHGVDAHGKTVRKKLLPFMAQQPPILVGMQACSGAHHGARE